MGSRQSSPYRNDAWNEGARPDGSPSANRAAIQRMLDIAQLTEKGNSQLVRLMAPGTYDINAALTMYSDATLELGPGVTIAASSSLNLLRSAALSASWTTVTLTWSSGTEVSVGWTAHGKSVGEFIHVDNVTPMMYMGVWRVKSVTSADAFKIDLMRVPTGSASAISGSMRARACTTGVSLIGGVYDYNYPSNTGDGTYNNHSMYFPSVARMRIKDLQGKNAVKYLMALEGMRDVIVDGVTSRERDSDVVKIYGPAYNVNIRHLSGAPIDDLMSLQNLEPAAFASYNTTSGGDIIGAVVDDLYSENDSAVGAVISVYGLAGYFMDNISISNVNGVLSNTSNPAGAVNFANVNCPLTFGTIHVNNVGCLHAGSALIVLNYATGQLLDIGGLTGRAKYGFYTSTSTDVAKVRVHDSRHNPYDVTASNYFGFLHGGTIDHMVFEDCDSNATNGASAHFIYLMDAGTIPLLEIVRQTLVSESGCRMVGIAGGTLTRVVFRECLISSGINCCIDVTASTSQIVEFHNCVIDALAVASIRVASCVVKFFNCTFTNCSNGILRSVTHSGATTMEGSGNTLTGTSVWTVVASGSPTIQNNIEDSAQAPTFAASYTPDLRLGLEISPGALTGNISIANPSGVMPRKGVRVKVFLVQDGTGGRTVTWGTNYVFPTAWSDTGNTASTRSSVVFVSDGTKLVAQGANSWTT